jgi:hypothetical protein
MNKLIGVLGFYKSASIFERRLAFTIIVHKIFVVTGVLVA